MIDNREEPQWEPQETGDLVLLTAGFLASSLLFGTLSFLFMDEPVALVLSILAVLACISLGAFIFVQREKDPEIRKRNRDIPLFIIPFFGSLMALFCFLPVMEYGFMGIFFPSSLVVSPILVLQVVEHLNRKKMLFMMTVESARPFSWYVILSTRAKLENWLSERELDYTRQGTSLGFDTGDGRYIDISLFPWYTPLMETGSCHYQLYLKFLSSRPTITFVAKFFKADSSRPPVLFVELKEALPGMLQEALSEDGELSLHDDDSIICWDCKKDASYEQDRDQFFCEHCNRARKHNEILVKHQSDDPPSSRP
jgi:hypothetical protein